MRISLKHLLLGMSLGTIVVFFYGYIKLGPEVKLEKTLEQNPAVTDIKNFETLDIKEIIKPEVTTYINSNIKTQVEFMELNKLEHNPLEFKKEKPSLLVTTKPNEPKPTQVAPVPDTDTNINNQQVQTINAPEEVIVLIEKYASEYGVDKNMMLGIAKCESGFRENAVNGPYAGIYQFVSGTWVSNRRAMGLDENLDLRYNAEESVRTAAFKMSRDGFGAWPVCQHKAKILLGLKTNNI